jgi:hypothetical protein
MRKQGVNSDMRLHIFVGETFLRGGFRHGARLRAEYQPLSTIIKAE